MSDRVCSFSAAEDESIRRNYPKHGMDWNWRLEIPHRDMFQIADRAHTLGLKMDENVRAEKAQRARREARIAARQLKRYHPRPVHALPPACRLCGSRMPLNRDRLCAACERRERDLHARVVAATSHRNGGE